MCPPSTTTSSRSSLPRISATTLREGTSKRTIFPRASAARRWRSSKESTTSTSASIPSGGVPTLPPRPSMCSSAGRGASSSADSSPRTQRGTITGSPHTFSSPSSRISGEGAGEGAAGLPNLEGPARRRHSPSCVAPVRSTLRGWKGGVHLRRRISFIRRFSGWRCTLRVHRTPIGPEHLPVNRPGIAGGSNARELGAMNESKTYSPELARRRLPEDGSGLGRRLCPLRGAGGRPEGARTKRELQGPILAGEDVLERPDA